MAHCNKVVPLSSAPVFGSQQISHCVLVFVLQESCWRWHPRTPLNAFHGPALTSLWHWQNYCRVDFKAHSSPFWPFLYCFCFVSLTLFETHILNVSPHVTHFLFFFLLLLFGVLLYKIEAFFLLSRLVNWLWYPYNVVSFRPPRLCFFGLCHPSHHGQPAERGQ